MEVGYYYSPGVLNLFTPHIPCHFYAFIPTNYALKCLPLTLRLREGGRMMKAATKSKKIKSTNSFVSKECKVCEESDVTKLW